MKSNYSVARTLAKPTYRTRTTLHEFGQPMPRVVNEWWLVLALRDQAAAGARGEWLPFDPVALERKAARTIERLLDHRRRHAAPR